MPNTSTTSICAARTIGKPNQKPGPALAKPSVKIEYKPTIGDINANASENAELSVNSRNSAGGLPVLEAGGGIGADSGTRIASDRD
jgi:hypothetical protein